MVKSVWCILDFTLSIFSMLVGIHILTLDFEEWCIMHLLYVRPSLPHKIFLPTLYSRHWGQKMILFKIKSFAVYLWYYGMTKIKKILTAVNYSVYSELPIQCKRHAPWKLIVCWIYNHFGQPGMWHILDISLLSPCSGYLGFRASRQEHSIQFFVWPQVHFTVMCGEQWAASQAWNYNYQMQTINLTAGGAKLQKFWSKFKGSVTTN
jgi:hypothetical protein